MNASSSQLLDSGAHARLVANFCAAAAAHVGPNYFRIRRMEYELQRSLAPEVFGAPFARALDIGCGVGFKSVLLAGNAAFVRGIDIAAPYHGFAGGRPAAEVGAEILAQLGCDRVALSTGDFLTALAAEPESYDLIVSDYLFEHVQDLPDLTRAIAGALRPRGWTVHAVPNTHDALIQLADANVRPYWRRALSTLRGWLTDAGSGARLTGHGWIIPRPHSEFLADFADQFGVYELERTVLALQDAGLHVTAIQPTRERTFSVFARKAV
jgi:SAM-dependent methyltransferase